MSDKRTSQRFQPRAPFPVLVESARHWKSGLLHNLSARGAFISVDAEVWEGEEVHVVLGFPSASGMRLKFRALTVWRTICTDPATSLITPGYGLLFIPDSAGEAVKEIDSLTGSALFEPLREYTRTGRA